MHAHASAMSLRRLFAIFVALAVLFAPAVARAGGPFAAAPGHAQMMEQTGHCQMPPEGSAGHDKAPVKSCCIWMCTAVAAEPAAPVGGGLMPRAPAVLAIPTLHIAYLGEIATPPPRQA